MAMMQHFTESIVLTWPVMWIIIAMIIHATEVHYANHSDDS